MDCTEARQSFSDYLDGELGAQAKEATDAHLERCSVCRNELAAIRKAVGLVERLPRMSAPPAVLDRVRFHVASKARAKPRATPVALMGWRWAAVAGVAAAAVLAVLLTVLWTGDRAGSGVLTAPVAGAAKGTSGAQEPGGLDNVNQGVGVAVSPEGVSGRPDSPAGLGPDGIGPGGIRPDNMATRPSESPDVGPIAPLPDITPIPDAGKEQENGSLRIYVGPRSEFRGSNVVRLRPMRELDLGIAVQAVPGAKDDGGAEDRMGTGEEGVRTPTVVLCAKDIEKAGEQTKAILRSHGAEFTRSQRGPTVRFVAVLQGVKARKAVEALREMDAAKVVLEAVPQAAYEQTPATLVIELAPSN